MEALEIESPQMLTKDAMGGYSGAFLLQQQQIFWQILLHKTRRNRKLHLVLNDLKSVVKSVCIRDYGGFIVPRI